jgi:hypothetical protein
MKTFALATLLSSACAAVFAAAPEAPNVHQLQVFPKNLARQHYAANLMIFDKTTQRYVPTEAAAAWLDEDPMTGWPALAGKQSYLLTFAEPQMVTNFSLAAKNNNGTVSISIGDQALPPGDAAWTQVAKDVSVEALNQKRFVRALNKTAKCLLIETDIADPGPIYSLYVYGDRAAASEAIVPRAQAVDIRTIGEFVNQQTAFNVAALYAKGRVTYAGGTGSNISWQRAIDDNAETLLPIAGSTAESGAVIRFGGAQPISRLALLGDLAAKGTMDIFLLSQAPEVGQAVGLDGVEPSVKIKFDGTSARASADIAETNSVAMAIRWTPEAGNTAAFNLREIAAFANVSLADNEVAGAPAAIAAAAATEPDATTTKEEEKTEKTTSGTPGEGKEVIAAGPGGKESKDVIAAGPGGKEMKEPVAAGPPKTGFTPGNLGFPPRTPRNPVSP